MRHRHDHFFIGDQILDRHFLAVGNDFGATLVTKLFFHDSEFIGNDRGDTLRSSQDIEQVGDLVHHFLVLADDLVLLHIGQALQLHFENALRLRFGEAVAGFLQAEIF